MKNKDNWWLSDKEKEELMDLLMPELATLRIKAGISQGELANTIGVSRQTYGAVERQIRKMTWNTYLALIMFYDYNEKTHHFLHSMGLFPDAVLKYVNRASAPSGTNLMPELGNDVSSLFKDLDDQAIHSIKTLIMVEYARCKKLPGDVVIKSFDGKVFSKKISEEIESKKALKSIKKRQENND